MNLRIFVCMMAVVSFLGLGGADAAASAVPEQELLAPHMKVTLPDGKREALTITDLKVEAKIQGSLVETAMTITFFNPHDRAMAGDLEFPLPESGNVTGYALDVNGQMIDGVVVEKHAARIAYETEVRKGIDPGLVEVSRGNLFRTRVFPMPAQGHRTIRIVYVSPTTEIDGSRLHTIPTAFGAPVEKLSVRVEVVKSDRQPEIVGGDLADLAFEQWRDSWVAERSWEDVTISEALRIALPQGDDRSVRVEQSETGDYWFTLAPPTVPEIKATRPAPERVVILVDVSRSMGNKEGRIDSVKPLLTAWLKETRG
ncbi:MAG: VIT domain-containing protein, partial [Phycisphaeraceae bacterium]|nr:VIT domain-containing protein [Phycisphaeraceae bacterium]